MILLRTVRRSLEGAGKWPTARTFGRDGNPRGDRIGREQDRSQLIFEWVDEAAL